MQILPVNNYNVKTQFQTTFKERDDWSEGKLDPWVVEKKELGDEFIKKEIAYMKNLIIMKFH